MTPYYQSEGIAIYHADIRDLGALPTAAAVVTSPPYNAGVDYDTHDDSMTEDEYRELARASCEAVRASLSSDGRAWVNVGVSELHVWLDSLASAGLVEQVLLCWDYGISTSNTAWGSWRSPAAPHLRYGWEPVICARSGAWSRTPPEGMESWRDSFDDWATLCRNVWRIPPGASTTSSHPAVMPLELARRCIRLSTWPGEVVLDPFAGSGTTLVAARQLGRKAVGIEIKRTLLRARGPPARSGGFRLRRCRVTSKKALVAGRGAEIREAAPRDDGATGRNVAEEALGAIGLSLEMEVRVDGEPGRWRLLRFGKDGSVTAFGGPHRQWRSFLAEWCYPATRRGRGGRTRPGVLPPERRGLRDAWRAQKGFASAGQPRRESRR